MKNRNTATIPVPIPCPKCKGLGRVPMGDELLLTLGVLREAKKTTAPKVFNRLDNPFITVTAINNRLNDLVALGYAKRVKQGKTWVYSPSKP